MHHVYVHLRRCRVKHSKKVVGLKNRNKFMLIKNINVHVAKTHIISNVHYVSGIVIVYGV